MQQKANKESGAEGAQIDLVLDRRDQVINLCEMKYSLKPYDITPIYLQKLLDRRETFREATNTNKALHLNLVTASGLKKNAQAGMIQSEIVLDDMYNEKANRLYVKKNSDYITTPDTKYLYSIDDNHLIWIENTPSYEKIPNEVCRLQIYNHPSLSVERELKEEYFKK